MKSMVSALVRARRPSGGPRPRRAQWLSSVLLAAMAMPACTDTFLVNASTDAGQDPAITDHCAALGNNTLCTLRAAITIGNNLAGAHAITIGVPSITVLNGALPTMMAPLAVNGNHATIDGNGQGCFDLTDSGIANLGHADGATGSQLLESRGPGKPGKPGSGLES